MSAIIKDKLCISSINLMFILLQIYIFIKNNASYILKTLLLQISKEAISRRI